MKTNQDLIKRIDEHIVSTWKYINRNHPTLLTPLDILQRLPDNTNHYLSWRFEPHTIQEIRITIDTLIFQRCQE